MPATTDPLLEGLTAPQRDAVLHDRGPLLILAAAGSGKTRVITRRVARLILSGAPPWSILALTFTNKAAGEMRSRVDHLLLGGQDAPARDRGPTRGLTLATFHSLCARLVRRYAAQGAGVPLAPDFSILDAGDQQTLMKKVLASLDLSSANWQPRAMLARISSLKNEMIDADAFARSANDYFTRTLARIFAAYERALQDANACDFDDLLLHAGRMLRDDARVLGECRARWRHIMIDEYQDTNRAQLELATLLAGTYDPRDASTPGGNIVVVGDPDQAIYAWRGADLRNILDFEEHFPGARTITLGENFRSTAPILAVADHLIRRNKVRRHKDLFTSRAGGEKVEAVLVPDGHAEARLVAEWLRDRAREPDFTWRDAGVFYRNNALSRVVEDALRAAGIPYVIARGTAYYQREEVKNALAYLRVLANPRDETSLERILNVPARGLGDASVRVIEGHARAARLSLFEALRRASTIDGVSSRAANAAGAFVARFDEWSGHGTFLGEPTREPATEPGPAAAGDAAKGEASGPLSNLVSRVLRESGLEAMYRAVDDRAGDEDASATGRAGNLAELVSSARQFELEYDPASDPVASDPGADARESPPPPLLELLRAYLESVALVADADMTNDAKGAVTLMTLHAAKGLEFSAVAIVGLEEGLLPHSRAFEAEAQLEEERRLCFVGLTRARRRLLLTSAAQRTSRGVPERTIPSRFLDELDRAHVVFTDRSGDDDDLNPLATLDRRASARAPSPFPIGCTVRHPRFGVGTVLSTTSGRDARAQIRFRDVGVKTLVLEFAGLVRVG